MVSCQEVINILHGFIVTMVGCPYIGTQHHVCPVLRRINQGLREIGFCFFRFSQLPIDKAARVESTGLERIAFQRIIAIGQCAGVILQLNLGDSS